MESNSETSTDSVDELPDKFTKKDPQGNVIVDYIVDERLGKGNFSNVYAVVHSKFQKVAALKQVDKLFSEPTIWNFLDQISGGLHDLHTVNIIHRDLKPANVFLNKKGVVKIGDLGLSKLLSNENEKVTDLLGTEFYMAPERQGDQGYGFKSDIWSLGCITYELCTL
uniref:Protein kinase domain-containing protein n=1 Tax=Panagrolaimus sp. JU765 TaxID=591449 RepID=A0AC34QQC9_9BILA